MEAVGVCKDYADSAICGFLVFCTADNLEVCEPVMMGDVLGVRRSTVRGIDPS